MVAIILGVGYVGFCMFTQAPGDMTSAPSADSGSESDSGPLPAAQNKYSVKQDPYLAALLAPGGAPDSVQECRRFLSLLSVDLEQECPGVLPVRAPKIADARQTADIAAVKKLIEKCDSAVKGGNLEAAETAIKEGFDYCREHAEAPAFLKIDLYLRSVKLEYGRQNFDKCRNLIDEAIALSHLDDEYLIDVFAGLRCLVTGHEREAVEFNKLLAQYDKRPRVSAIALVRGLGKSLVESVETLPDGSYFKLIAQLAEMDSAVWPLSKADARMERLAAEADKAHDIDIAQYCRAALKCLSQHKAK